MTTAAPTLKIYPPQGLAPITDETWRRWLLEVVWPLVGKGVDNSGPQGTFPQLQVGKARWTNDNAFQELINVDQGIYSTYSSTVNNIIYGFACNVFRGGGVDLTVGAQINAIGRASGSAGVFGIACTAAVEPATGSTTLVAFEPDIGSSSATNINQKWGMNPVFKDRGDGVATVVQGVGAGLNFYNYAAYAMVITSQARSTAGEFCGWSVGMQFLDASLDFIVARIWNNATQYNPGDVVNNGGLNWKCVISNTNVVPAGAAAQWVQYANGTEGATGAAKAVGIDFTPMTVTSMARMWSAIRLRNTMAIHWEETGSIATFMDSANTRHVLSANWNVGLGIYVRNLQVDVTSGALWVSTGITGLGGGAAPTFGTIGGAGPAAAAQRGWYKMVDSTTGNPFWLPVWQ